MKKVVHTLKSHFSFHERPQSRGEEIASAVAHGLGILFCVVAFPFLIVKAATLSTASLVFGVCLFGFGMLMVYVSSTFMHLTNNKKLENFLERLDHIGIFMLIAGTYTPLVLKFTNASFAAPFLWILWIIVTVAIIFKILFFGRFKAFSVFTYLGLGLMMVFVSKPLFAHMPSNVFWCILAGSIAYLTGVIFFLWRKLQYGHAIWHLFVLGGSITHFVGVYMGLSVMGCC